MNLPCRFRPTLVCLLVFCLTLPIATSVWAVTQAEIDAAADSAFALYTAASDEGCESDIIETNAVGIIGGASTDPRVNSAELVILQTLYNEQAANHGACVYQSGIAITRTNLALMDFNNALFALDFDPPNAQTLYDQGQSRINGNPTVQSYIDTAQNYTILQSEKYDALVVAHAAAISD